MRLIAFFMALALLVPGCAGSRKPGQASDRETPERRLAAAVEALEKGDVGEATTMLAAISAEPGVPGVTDEALFRLALLQLGAEAQTAGPPSARQTLERLQSDYPASPWSKQAAPLLPLLVSASDALRANRDLKALNLSLRQEIDKLTLEGNELRARLEKLKHLDLELEGKSR